MKKERLKPVLHLLICLFLAWMITNGWAYVCLGLGIAFNWSWAKAIGTGYLAILWLPVTPEKIITIPIAILLQRFLFPKDRAIGRWLKLKLYELKAKIKGKINKKKKHGK